MLSSVKYLSRGRLFHWCLQGYDFSGFFNFLSFEGCWKELLDIINSGNCLSGNAVLLLRCKEKIINNFLISPVKIYTKYIRETTDYYGSWPQREKIISHHFIMCLFTNYSIRRYNFRPGNYALADFTQCITFLTPCYWWGKGVSLRLSSEGHHEYQIEFQMFGPWWMWCLTTVLVSVTRKHTTPDDLHFCSC